MKIIQKGILVILVILWLLFASVLSGALCRCMYELFLMGWRFE